jgi:hypothetical protein
MLNQKKVEIFSRKFRKSLAKQFLEVALKLPRDADEFSSRCSSNSLAM